MREGNSREGEGSMRHRGETKGEIRVRREGRGERGEPRIKARAMKVYVKRNKGRKAKEKSS